jgi:copper chaperone
MSKQKATLKIDGMSCGHCVKTVRTALADSDGVDVIEVEIGSATILFDDALADIDAVSHSVDEVGFAVVNISVD